MRYSFDSRIRFSETGEDGKLKITSLVNYFQDCSNFHSNSLNMGAEELRKKGRVWLLSSWQIEVERRPREGEEVRISTWAYDFKGFYGYRNYTMETINGARLAYANTIWVYLNADNGTPCKVDAAESEGYGLEEKLDMKYAPRKVAIPTASITREPFKVLPCDLDLNHHVNNGRYIVMAEKYLPIGFEVGQMRAEYKNQATLDKTIVPHIHEEAGSITIALCDEEQNPYAVVEFKTSSH